MSETPPKTTDDTAKPGDGTVEIEQAAAEWESPILTKLPAVEAGKPGGPYFDGSGYS